MKSKLQQIGSSYIYILIFLGILSAFGPFITDMYLPTLPSMAQIFNTSTAQVQLGLTTSLIGLAIGQVFLGPLSDKYGRKSILFISLIIFSIASIGCIYTDSIYLFNFYRFFQGLGGAGGIVLSRSIATDCYHGKALASTLAIIGAINGIMPVIAPVTGGFVAGIFGWQGIFVALLAVGIILIGLSLPFEESLPSEKRNAGNVFSIFKSYPVLFKNHKFVYCVFIFTFTYGVLFSYISSSSFIVEKHYSDSEFFFSLTFGVNAIAMAIGSGFVLKLKSLARSVLGGTLGITIITLLQIIFYFSFDNFYIYEGLTFIMAFLLGMIFTATSAMGMEEGRAHSGAASAMLGTFGYMFGGIVSPIVGMGNIMISYIIIILVCSLMTVVFSYRYLRQIEKLSGSVSSDIQPR